jgi:hypothetical protein
VAKKFSEAMAADEATGNETNVQNWFFNYFSIIQPRGFFTSELEEDTFRQGK